MPPGRPAVRQPALDNHRHAGHADRSAALGLKRAKQLVLAVDA